MWEYVRVQCLVEHKNGEKDGETEGVVKHVQCVFTNIL